MSATQFEDTARFAFDHTVRIDAFGQGARMLIFLSGLLAVCVAFYRLVWPQVVDHMVGLALPWRALVAVAMILPLGEDRGVPNL